MNKSESIAKLTDALSKAQGEMVAARKDSENPFFKSKYSDLASVYDACRAPLAKYGLAIIQAPTLNESGRVGLETLIAHSSGEWVEPPPMVMKPVKDDPQGFGSVITYLRRYCLSAVVGISSELDDDGNAASGPSRASKDTKIEQPRPAKTEPRNPVVQTAQQAVKGALEKISDQPNGASSSAPTREPGEDDDADDRTTIEDEPGMVVNFARSFKDALPKHLQKDDDKLRHQWLSLSFFLDKDNKPSSKMILKSEFQDWKAKACEWARMQK